MTTGEEDSITPDIVAFAIGLSLAWFLQWETRDLIWSLWLASLSLGYITILTTIFAGLFIGAKMTTHPEFPKKHRWTAKGAGLGFALFLLGFFSIHFCGFHAGHAVFLSALFPLDGLANPENFGDAFMNPFKLWQLVFTELLPDYGLFILAAAIAERKSVFGSLIKARSLARKIKDNPEAVKDSAEKSTNKQFEKNIGDPFFAPYKNVVRMHILIFFFAIARMLKIDSFPIYAVVYFVYFFPWRVVRKKTSS